MTLDDLTQVIEARLDKNLLDGTTGLRRIRDKRKLSILIVEGIQSAIRTKATLSSMCNQVGYHCLLELKIPYDSFKAFKMGFLLLEVLGELGYVDIFRKKKKEYKDPPYFIKIVNWKAMGELWAEVEPMESAYMQPELIKPEPWETSVHPKAGKMIKKAKDSLLKTLTRETHPMLFDVLDSKQSTGFKVNQRVLSVYSAMFCESNEVFEHMNPLLTHEQREGMRMEAKAVLDTATKIGEQEFWHLYSFDFRGRIYPLTGYFHEQSSDNAKGLLELSKRVSLGTYGYQWLLIYAANNWGEDKLSLQGRMDFALANISKWFEWAMDPIGNQEWTKADKPWCFLATIMELLAVEIHGDLATFESGLITYIDGTTNGSQHLTALARDETIAHHVNLVATEKPGDLYTLIAESSYEQIMSQYDPDNDQLFKKIRADLMELRRPLDTMTNQAQLNQQWVKINAYKDANIEDIRKVCPQFWLQAKVAEKKRKIAKRNVMTLGYGSETAGFSDQLKEDCPKMIDELKFIENTWTWFMADLNYKNCLKQLPGPASMLSLFKQLAVLSNSSDEQFKWTVPMTNFPAVQTYFEAETQRINVRWLGDLKQIFIRVSSNYKLNKRKQKQAASPNVIHSFDAAHLTMTCLSCEFETVTVHDSFGCAAGNMEDLFRIVREQWVEFYSLDPLNLLLDEHDALELFVFKGSLSHEDILDSEFAFS